jgi:hypothetical protein
VFVNGGFLEYEVYSALVRQGIAAVPRLRFSILELLSDNTERWESYEVNVAATADSELWLIEELVAEPSGSEYACYLYGH